MFSFEAVFQCQSRHSDIIESKGENCKLHDTTYSFLRQVYKSGRNDDSNDRKGELFAFENKAPVRSLVR